MATTYKSIIANMVEMEVHKFVESHVNGYVRYPDKITLAPANKDFDKPSFIAEQAVDTRDYSIRGYIDDYGTIHVTSIWFERDKIIDQNRTDWWAKDNLRHESHFIYEPKELKSFKFDI